MGGSQLPRILAPGEAASFSGLSGTYTHVYIPTQKDVYIYIHLIIQKTTVSFGVKFFF